MRVLTASNANQLRQALRALDVEVPQRSEGRTKLQTERYACAHLLATLPTTQWLFPLSVDHGDRPDFHLVDGTRDIGIEHVEAVAQNEAHADVLREQGLGPDTYFLRPAQPGERPKTAARLRREILEDAAGGPWIGDSAERQWAEAMAFFIQRKTQVSHRPGFERHSESWLLIYDNWPLPNINADLAARKLIAQSAMASGLASFDRIYVLDEKVIWTFC